MADTTPPPRRRRVVRRVLAPASARLRAPALALLVAPLLALGVAAPAAAEPPTGWEVVEDPSLLEFLTVLVFVPLAIIAVIVLLVSLPSMIGREQSDPALVFSQQREWFGGPRQAPQDGDEPDGPADADPSSKQTGGAGAHW